MNPQKELLWGLWPMGRAFTGVQGCVGQGCFGGWVSVGCREFALWD